MRPNEAPSDMGTSLPRNLSHARPKSFQITLGGNGLCVANSHAPWSVLQAGDDMVPQGSCCTAGLSRRCPGASIHPRGCSWHRSFQGQDLGCAAGLVQGEPLLCPGPWTSLGGRCLKGNIHQDNSEWLHPGS